MFLLKGENEPVLKYKGIILRWDYDDDNVNDSQLPLVLCIGSLKVINIVHRTISDMFDTVLRPIRISEVSRKLCFVNMHFIYEFYRRI